MTDPDRLALDGLRSEQGRPDGFVASNVASAETSLTGAGALIDAAVDAGANQVSGPSLSRSDADALYRDALAKPPSDDASERAALLAKAAGRELGRVTAMVESGASDVPLFAKAEAARDSATPVVSGTQETTATVSVTYELRVAGAARRSALRGG